MPGFTKINFENIDSSTPEGRDARFARSHIDSEHVGVTRFRYAPNVHSEMGHRHREQEEVYVVLGGSGRVKLDDEVVELAPWDVLRVAPQTVRAFSAGGDGLELLIAANDRPEGGDGERVEGFWPAS
jgi:mannose-6-phosphate isomerase-like protein (cupin superfamily)